MKNRWIIMAGSIALAGCSAGGGVVHSESLQGEAGAATAHVCYARYTLLKQMFENIEQNAENPSGEAAAAEMTSKAYAMIDVYRNKRNAIYASLGWDDSKQSEFAAQKEAEQDLPAFAHSKTFSSGEEATIFWDAFEKKTREDCPG